MTKLYICPECKGIVSFYTMTRCIECASCGWSGQLLRECDFIEYKTAWDLAGDWSWIYAGVQCRVKRGATLYEEAAATSTGGGVVLKRLVEDAGRLRQVSRWVTPNTEIELVDPVLEG